MLGYLDEIMRPLVWILPKMIGYVETCKDKGGDKTKNIKLMSLHIDGNNLLKKYKTIWFKIEGLQNIELDALPVYDSRYIKIKIKTYGDKVYTNFRGLNVPEGWIECKSFTVISIDSLLVYHNRY